MKFNELGTVTVELFVIELRLLMLPLPLFGIFIDSLSTGRYTYSFNFMLLLMNEALVIAPVVELVFMPDEAVFVVVVVELAVLGIGTFGCCFVDGDCFVKIVLKSQTVKLPS